MRWSTSVRYNVKFVESHFEQKDILWYYFGQIFLSNCQDPSWDPPLDYVCISMCLSIRYYRKILVMCGRNPAMVFSLNPGRSQLILQNNIVISPNIVKFFKIVFCVQMSSLLAHAVSTKLSTLNSDTFISTIHAKCLCLLLQSYMDCSYLFKRKPKCVLVHKTVYITNSGQEVISVLQKCNWRLFSLC